MKHKTIIILACILAISLSGVSYGMERGLYYEISVTNMTRGQTFTPILAVTHTDDVQLFTPGMPAIEELAMLAEGGATAPLEGLLMGVPAVGSTATAGPTGPGETTTVMLRKAGGFNLISLAAMLIPTNDGFIALRGVTAPRTSAMFLSPAFDAGSEMNDELCVSIPGGGGCEGIGFGEDDGEGYVHIHGGIKGIGDLDPVDYDWRNPVARIVIKKVHVFNNNGHNNSFGDFLRDHR